MPRRSLVAIALAGVGLALLLVLFAPLASNDPDGLERVATDEGFADDAEQSDGGLAGYSVPGVDNEAVSTILAGVIGVLAVTGLTLGAAFLLHRRRHEPSATARAARPRDGSA